MRVPGTISRTKALAARVLDRLNASGEAMSGDLLEELRGGRSEQWYWRQVMAALGVALADRMRRMLGPAWFAAAWSLFYPVWARLLESVGASFVMARWAAMDWPYSTGLKMVSGMAPAVGFVWLGLMVYLLAEGAGREILRLRFLLRLSISLNVMLAGLLVAFRLAGHTFPDVNRTRMFATPDAVSTCVAVGVSLLVGLRVRAGQVRRSAIAARGWRRSC